MIGYMSVETIHVGLKGQNLGLQKSISEREWVTCSEAVLSAFLF